MPLMSDLYRCTALVICKTAAPGCQESECTCRTSCTPDCTAQVLTATNSHICCFILCREAWTRL